MCDQLDLPEVTEVSGPVLTSLRQTQTSLKKPCSAAPRAPPAVAQNLIKPLHLTPNNTKKSNTDVFTPDEDVRQDSFCMDIKPAAPVEPVTLIVTVDTHTHVRTILN